MLSFNAQYSDKIPLLTACWKLYTVLINAKETMVYVNKNQFNIYRHSFWLFLEPIFVIFGTVQRSFILSTSVNCVLKKIITQVAPPINKINNSQ